MFVGRGGRRGSERRRASLVGRRYDAAIRACAESRRLDEALALLREMQRLSESPALLASADGDAGVAAVVDEAIAGKENEGGGKTISAVQRGLQLQKLPPAKRARV